MSRPASSQCLFLYLTTKGWKTSKPHEIEIWYVEEQGAYYIVSELRARSHWVRNMRHDSNVQVRVGEKNFDGRARFVDPESEWEVAKKVTRLMKESYDWGEGPIVELRPRA